MTIFSLYFIMLYKFDLDKISLSNIFSTNEIMRCNEINLVLHVAVFQSVENIILLGVKKIQCLRDLLNNLMVLKLYTKLLNTFLSLKKKLH